MTAPLPTISGLSDLSGRYDAVLSDVWGVIHNGVAAFPEAVEALREFRKAGGRAVLITNAPRPSGPIVAMLDRLGVPRDAYDAIVSSGDATRAMIEKYRGKAIHHVGPPTEDDALYDGLDVRRSLRGGLVVTGSRKCPQSHRPTRCSPASRVIAAGSVNV